MLTTAENRGISVIPKSYISVKRLQVDIVESQSGCITMFFQIWKQWVLQWELVANTRSFNSSSWTCYLLFEIFNKPPLIAALASLPLTATTKLLKCLCAQGKIFFSKIVTFEISFPILNIQISSDFVAAATRGAVAVVDGNVMAINPGEDEK